MNNYSNSKAAAKSLTIAYSKAAAIHKIQRLQRRWLPSNERLLTFSQGLPTANSKAAAKPNKNSFEV